MHKDKYVTTGADLGKILGVGTKYLCSGYPRAQHGWARGEKFLILQDVRLQETAISAPVSSGYLAIFHANFRIFRVAFSKMLPLFRIFKPNFYLMFIKRKSHFILLPSRGRGNTFYVILFP